MDEIIEKIIELAAEDTAIDSLWLYGSRARGDHRSDSDYDLAIKYRARIADPVKSRLRPELQAMDWTVLGGEISVADIEQLAVPLAVNVVNEGQLLLDKAPFETASLYKKSGLNGMIGSITELPMWANSTVRAFV